MSIKYNKHNQIFTISTSSSSLLLRLTEDQKLSAMYWGSKVNLDNITFNIRDRHPMPFLPSLDGKYQSHRIMQGKPMARELPYAYTTDENDSMTVSFLLLHKGKSIRLIITTYDELDVISFSVNANQESDIEDFNGFEIKMPYSELVEKDGAIQLRLTSDNIHNEYYGMYALNGQLHAQKSGSYIRVTSSVDLMSIHAESRYSTEYLLIHDCDSPMHLKKRIHDFVRRRINYGIYKQMIRPVSAYGIAFSDDDLRQLVQTGFEFVFEDYASFGHKRKEIDIRQGVSFRYADILKIRGELESLEVDGINVIIDTPYVDFGILSSIAEKHSEKYMVITLKGVKPELSYHKCCQQIVMDEHMTFEEKMHLYRTHPYSGVSFKFDVSNDMAAVEALGSRMEESMLSNFSVGFAGHLPHKTILENLSKRIERFKSYRHVIHFGDAYDLSLPHHYHAINFVDKGKNESILVVQALMESTYNIRLYGLTSDTLYGIKDTDIALFGNFLTHWGLPINFKDASQRIKLFQLTEKETE